VSTDRLTGADLSPSDVPFGQRIAGLPDNVVIRQLYLGCLSQASYLVGDATTGRGIVVDPRRDIAEVLGAAEAEGLAIELVVETHFHADFLSGHLELAAATGADIGVGAAGTTEFPARALADGERIDLGGVVVDVMETPGHTPESISLVVRPAPDRAPVAVLTGDTLFIGDVGRPDLLVSAGRSAEDLATHLHGSLQRLVELPDATVVLPAHGAGSACGRALSTETVSTIGEQRETNYALAPMGVEDFVALVTEGQPAAPAYFGHDAVLNRQMHELHDEGEAPAPLDLDAVDRAVADGAVLVDVRPVEDYTGGHLAGALHVPLGGRFAEQVGTVVPVDAPVVLTGDAAAALEARVRLARIGFDQVIGVLLDPERVLVEHPDRADRLSRLTASDLAARRAEVGDRLQLIDVRTPSEVAVAPLDGARNIPLTDVRATLDDLDRDAPVVAVCAGGARSAVAAGLLAAAGFADVSDVLGGYTALSADTDR
jgi:hydroxyacylglutathione hydrolase